MKGPSSPASRARPIPLKWARGKDKCLARPERLPDAANAKNLSGGVLAPAVGLCTIATWSANAALSRG